MSPWDELGLYEVTGLSAIQNLGHFFQVVLHTPLIVFLFAHSHVFVFTHTLQPFFVADEGCVCVNTTTGG